MDIDIILEGSVCFITTTARCAGRTGVEMEALTAASITALTIYDMLKALSHDLCISGIELLHKAGGRSGTITRTPSHSIPADRTTADRTTADRTTANRTTADRTTIL